SAASPSPPRRTVRRLDRARERSVMARSSFGLRVEAVGVMRLSRGDAVLREIAPHQFPVARARVAVAAGASRYQCDRLTGGYDAAPLGEGGHAGAALGARRTAGLAAEQPPGRRGDAGTPHDHAR